MAGTTILAFRKLSKQRLQALDLVQMFQSENY